ncbi:MAG: 4-hydroxy-tetrahydrodipicolinate synthase [Actinomycetes bacterium]
MSVLSPRFGRVITAMVTPFADDGSLDLDGAASLARYLSEHGSDGLVVAGTTGEAPVLTDEERLSLVACVAEAVTIPVIAGLTTNDTLHSVGLTRQARSLGAAGVLAVTPYYNRPSQAGLLAHFGAIAESTDLPVMLYDIPVRTGRKIAAETILGLIGERSNVVAVKDAAGDVVAASELLAEAPSSFELYSGDDGLTLALMAVGAVGVVSVASHWVGSPMRTMLESFVAGDVAAATGANRELLSSYRFESSERWPNPMPTKAILRAAGLAVGQCRLPMGDADADLDAAALILLADLGVPRG